MATKHDGSNTKPRASQCNQEPVPAPYTGVSSFKNFDNTIVSAYDTGASKFSYGPRLVKSKSVSDISLQAPTFSDVKYKKTAPKHRIRQSKIVQPNSSDANHYANTQSDATNKNHNQEGLARIKRSLVSVASSFPNHLKDIDSESANITTEPPSDKTVGEQNTDGPLREHPKLVSRKIKSESDNVDQSRECTENIRTVLHKPPLHDSVSQKYVSHGNENLKIPRRKLPPVPKSRLGVPRVNMDIPGNADGDKEKKEKLTNCIANESDAVKKAPDKNVTVTDSKDEADNRECKDGILKENEYLRKINNGLETQCVLGMTSLESQSGQIDCNDKVNISDHKPGETMYHPLHLGHQNMDGSLQKDVDAAQKHLVCEKDVAKVSDINYKDDDQIGLEGNADVSCNDAPQPDIFRFDRSIIQELTDGIMVKPDSHYSDCEHDLDSGIQDEPNNVYMDQSVRLVIEGSSSSGTSDVCSPDPKNDNYEGKGNNVSANEIIDTQDNEAVFVQMDSHNKPVQDSDSNNSTSQLGTTDATDPKNKHNSNVGVVRTPSYRRTVMARAKSRYSKKSNMLKECSCVRNEKGEIEECKFCKYMNRRSQTSLGNAATHEAKCDSNSDKENALSETSSPRRAQTPAGLSSRTRGAQIDAAENNNRNIKKVQVSSRVDLLMRSDLFKKHLHKHEHLLSKHTKSYRQFGVQKSVSNLDLSEGYGQNDEDYSANDCDNDATSEIEVSENLNLSMSFDGVSFAKHRPRRYSLTGESDTNMDEFEWIENAKSDRKRKQLYGTIPKSQSQPRSRPPIPFANVRASTNSSLIPSFNEFRQRRDTMNEERNEESPSQIQTSEDNVPHGNRQRRHQIKTVKSTARLESVDNNTNAGSSIASQVDTSGPGSSRDLPRHPEQNSQPRRRLPLERHCSSDGNESKPHRRSKQRVKARTLSRIEMDGDLLAVSSGSESSQKSPRDHNKPGSKRPRSLISKKSSLVELIRETEGQPEIPDDSGSRKDDTGTRPKARVGPSIIRSESDSKVETERGSIQRAAIKEGHSRHQSLTGKGHTFVSFKDVEESSRCSTQDVGESETSTSVAGSLSDSIYSEVMNDDRSNQSTIFDRSDDLELSDRLKAGKDDFMAPVLRSTSDACEITPEAARKRRERKERPYKSDPFSGTEMLPASKRYHLREERAKLRQIQQDGFSSSSKEEILSFLDSVVAGGLETCDSFPSLEELNEDDEHSPSDFEPISDGTRKARKHPSNVSSLSTDSGVIGQEGSRDSQQSSPSNTLRHSQSVMGGSTWLKSVMGSRRSLSASCGDLSKHEFYECNDCGQSDQFDLHHVIQICPQCYKRRIERKKTVQEIMDTEINYGRDLNILKEEFYAPMMKAGLLNQDQLNIIFLNLDELIHVNKHFISKLKAAINQSNQQSDEDLQHVQIGSLFLESSTMFLTFENYCVNQGQAPLLLEQLEKEKELLRIFLHVSQSENQTLRRMHLKSFLMVPVQRIMKYPLLLDRLNRTTFDSHPDKHALREAKEKIEDILGNINAKSKTSNLKHRKSERHYSVTEKMEVSRIALETLRWNRKDACDVITSKLHVSQPVDHLWASKRCKNYKFTTVHAVLLTLSPQMSVYDRESNAISNNNNNNNKNNNKTVNNSNADTMTSSGGISSSGSKNNDNSSMSSNNNNNARTSGTDRVQSAAVVLIKEKGGKYQAMRDPFMLEKCVVSQDPEFTEVFEILEWNKESYLLRAGSLSETNLWVQNLRLQMKNLGCWRRRRNALPNILLNHLS